MIRELLRKLRVERRARAWQNGYDWAAGELLKGQNGETLERVYEQIAYGAAFDPGPFDDGAYRACEDYEKLTARIS